MASNQAQIDELAGRSWNTVEAELYRRQPGVASSPSAEYDVERVCLRGASGMKHPGRGRGRATGGRSTRCIEEWIDARTASRGTDRRARRASRGRSVSLPARLSELDQEIRSPHQFETTRLETRLGRPGPERRYRLRPERAAARLHGADDYRATGRSRRRSSTT